MRHGTRASAFVLAVAVMAAVPGVQAAPPEASDLARSVPAAKGVRSELVDGPGVHAGAAPSTAGGVRAIQDALREKGFDPGPSGGVMGPRTAAALRDFQQIDGLPPTGRVDSLTLARLGVVGEQAR